MCSEHFMVSLFLNNFFTDHRREARIFINNRIKTVRDLENHIQKIFGITEFYLTSRNQFLPSSEDIRILERGDCIWAWSSANLITACNNTLENKNPQYNEHHSNNLPSERNSMQTEDHYNNRVHKENRKKENSIMDANLLENIVDTKEYQQSVSNDLNDHMLIENVNSYNGDGREIIENENFIKSNGISHSFMINAECSGKKAVTTSQINEFGLNTSTYSIGNGKVNSRSTSIYKTKQFIEDPCNSEFENSSAAVDILSIQSSEHQITNEITDTINHFTSSSQKFEVTNKAAHKNENCINGQSEAPFEPSKEEVVAADLYTTFSRDMSNSESSIPRSSIDGSFVTKRKRKRVRKHKHREPSLQLSNKSKTEIASIKYLKTEAAPVAHIRFDDQDLSDEVDEDKSSNLNNVSCESSAVKEQSMIDLTISDNVVIEENQLLKYPIMNNLVPRKGDIVSFKILRISEKYTPEISKNIVAKIINYDKESKSINSQILAGKSEVLCPKGKFYMDQSEEEDTINFTWDTLKDIRLLFP